MSSRGIAPDEQSDGEVRRTYALPLRIIFRRSWFVSLWRAARTVVAHAPASMVAIAIIWIAYKFSGPDAGDRLDALGVAMPWDVEDWHILTAGLTSSSLCGCLCASAAVVLLSVPAERVLGSRRFVAAAAVIQLIVVPMGLMTARAVEETGLNRWGADLLNSQLLTPLVWVCGVASYATGRMTTLWRRRLSTILIAIPTTLMLFSGAIEDFVTLSAVLVGLAVAFFEHTLVGGRGMHPALPGHGVSIRETRVLLATILTAVSLGPVIVGLDSTTTTVFRIISQFTWLPDITRADVLDLCSPSGPGLASTECADAVLAARQSGIGPSFANLVPLLLQLVIYLGVARGRRAAWWLALVVQLVVIAVIVLEVNLTVEPWDGDLLWTVNLASTIAPWIATSAALLVCSDSCTIRVDRRRIRSFFSTVMVAAGGTAAVWLIGATELRNTFFPRVDTAAIWRELPIRYAPPAIADLIGTNFVPTTSVGWILYEWVGTAFWLAVAVALWRLLMSVPNRRTAHHIAHARTLRANGTGDHLQGMTLWEGNSYWFAPNDMGYVAYRVRSGVAVTMGEPVVREAAKVNEVATGFERFAVTQGWRPVWYSVRGPFAQGRAANGYSRIQVAEEAIMLTEDANFSGKRFQNIRTARNHARREGIRAVWTTWHDADPTWRYAIKALAEEWIADKALPEMGFTLGTVTELADPDTHLLLAVGEDGTVHAVTSWLDVYENGKLAGYILDMMRRRATGFRQAMEFLFAEALSQAREDGLEWISLSGAPLAHYDAVTHQTGTLDTLLDRIGASMEPLYGFRSLAASKHKFHPRSEPWYLSYADEMALPAITLAVCGCYLPDTTAKDAFSVIKAWWTKQRSSSVHNGEVK